jgi:hypothetical protein
MRTFRPLSLLLGCLLGTALLLGPATPAVAWPDWGPGWTDMKALENFVKSGKSNNDDINQYIEAVLNFIKALAPDEPPAAPPEGASEEDLAAHKKALEQHEKDLAAYTKEREKYIKDAIKQFRKALMVSKVQTETNLRDDVNKKAAACLAELGTLLDDEGREDLSSDIVKDAEALHKVKDHTVNSDRIADHFATIAKLGQLDGLKWMADNYIHTKDLEKAFLIAAHRAMVLYKNVPGTTRYAICESMIRTYAGVEAQAEQSDNTAATQAKKRFWDAIRTDTIPCVQYFAGHPKDAEGRVLDKMQAFQEWFRDVKNPRKAPWLDDEPQSN